jgi:hypothetical protein
MYEATWNSVKRLSTAVIAIETKDKNNQLSKEMEGTIISTQLRVKRGGNKRIQIEFNPYFIQMSESGLVTRLDLSFRSQLKGNISKAMYRFYNGQRDFYGRSGKFGCYLMNLCKAINLKTDGIPQWRLRARIKSGLKELERNGYLKGQIMSNDYVEVFRMGTA